MSDWQREQEQWLAFFERMAREAMGDWVRDYCARQAGQIEWELKLAELARGSGKR